MYFQSLAYWVMGLLIISINSSLSTSPEPSLSVFMKRARASMIWSTVRSTCCIFYDKKGLLQRKSTIFVSKNGLVDSNSGMGEQYLSLFSAELLLQHLLWRSIFRRHCVDVFFATFLLWF
tara:strand:+ start:581 stop:940 length:360 start_codon:yes stop_codon:yes gene_type:complete